MATARGRQWFFPSTKKGEREDLFREDLLDENRTGDLNKAMACQNLNDRHNASV